MHQAEAGKASSTVCAEGTLGDVSVAVQHLGGLYAVPDCRDEMAPGVSLGR
jgi:hypothetical protein